MSWLMLDKGRTDTRRVAFDLSRRSAAVLRVEQARRAQERVLQTFAEVMEQQSRQPALTIDETGAVEALNARPAAASAMKKLATTVPARMEKMVFNLGPERSPPAAAGK